MKRMGLSKGHGTACYHARMSHSWRVETLLEGTGYSSSATLLVSADLTVVVDTGLSIQESELKTALRHRRLAPSDIDVVVNTHLHVDHCLNNALFSRAEIFMSEQEWRWTTAFYKAIFSTREVERAATEFYPELPSYHLSPRTIRNVARLARLFWREERLGNPDRFRWLESTALPAGLELMQTPGHTPHHVSVRVPSAATMLAGDAVLAEDLDANVKTMIPHHRETYLRSRDAVLQAGLTVVPGHGRAFQPSAPLVS
jgi:glyoxylase-like metal-dependent hydrolase (beta-lactamase superfamily II)